ncbi:MAG: hypothetical protein A2150_05185 [Candidatus Muproteobacteria bacterium RBG_16_64_11]|uniref:Lipoprotein n=1 Tax=Candidatus Muproteobacteria bacterium RBG_16_64_11 TaxID=1817758 RepID=A0A1F6TEE4_9PROT|nr:MAG: hypothetical protein A2150_05185 [Candidatus Muproteobacteria bacterium RBG_16_64_11]
MIKGSFGLMLLFGLAACGGGGDTGAGGGGGCGGGAGVAGIVLCADSVAPKYNGVLTPSVDIVQNLCTDGTPEPYFDHQATVTITATLATGATIPPVSPTVTITRYVIDYTANPGVVGPTIQSTGNLFDTITVAVGGSTSRDVQLMTTQQKERFLLDLAGAGAFDGIFRSYAVTYTFYGQDQFGNNLTARGFGQVVIGNYQNCAT